MLDDYTNTLTACWLRKWILHVVLLHCMCVSVCVHTCGAMFAGRARLKAVNEMCVSRRLLVIRDRNRLQLKPQLFSGFDFGFIQERQLLRISSIRKQVFALLTPIPLHLHCDYWTHGGLVTTCEYTKCRTFGFYISAQMQIRTVGCQGRAWYRGGRSLFVIFMAVVFSSMCFCLHSW